MDSGYHPQLLFSDFGNYFEIKLFRKIVFKKDYDEPWDSDADYDSDPEPEAEPDYECYPDSG